MSGVHWLPGAEQDLVDLCVKWKAGLKDPAKVTAFGWKQEELTPVVNKLDGFLTARETYKVDNSTTNRMLKDDAKEAVKEVMQDFAAYNIRFNRLMTAEDKLYFGVITPDPIPTPNPPPTSFPEAEADTSVIRQVTICFWDSLTKKRPTASTARKSAGPSSTTPRRR